MKLQYVALVLVVCLFTACGARTPYETFRQENKEEIAFTIGASSFLTHLFIDAEDVRELKSVVSGIRKYRVLVAAANVDDINQSFDKLVNDKTYEELLYVNSKGNKVQLYLFKKAGKIKEVVCKVKTNESFVVLSAEGNLKINDVNRLVEEVVTTR